MDTLAEPSGNSSPIDAPVPLGKTHARRWREIYRSACWPSQDLIEIEPLAGGMPQRVAGPSGHETPAFREAQTLLGEAAAPAAAAPVPPAPAKKPATPLSPQ